MIQNQYRSLEDMYQSGTGTMGTTSMPQPTMQTTGMPTSQGSPMFKPIGLDQSYGTVDKYFSDTLKGLGYGGSILGKNNSFYSQSGSDAENMGGVDATMIDPAFAAWAKANGISTEAFKGDDYSIMRLLQNGNVLGEKKYTTKTGLDKFAEVAGPLALAIGTGGVLGQALGFINPALNPLDPSTWSGAAGGATGGTAGAGAGGSAIDAALAEAMTAAGTLAPEGVGALIPSGVALGGIGGGSLLAGGMLGGGLGAGNLGGSTLGSVLSNIGGTSNTIKDIVKGVGSTLTGGGGNQQAGNFDITKILSSLAGIYAGNRQQEQAKDFYDKLSSQFGPNSAYAQQLRQELERRDSASGRRSQYGPREVELQAKLADQASKNLTTMTALMDKQNAGLTQQLQAGLTGGQVSGLNDIFGNVIKNIGSDIWKDFKNTDFYKDLFDWFGD